MLDFKKLILVATASAIISIGLFLHANPLSDQEPFVTPGKNSTNTKDYFYTAANEQALQINQRFVGDRISNKNKSEPTRKASVDIKPSLDKKLGATLWPHIPSQQPKLNGGISSFDETQKSLGQFRDFISTHCPDCRMVENIVTTMLHESCHITPDVDFVKNTMSSNAMYAFMLALKENTNKETFNTFVVTAKNTVDCENDYGWVNKTKDLYNAFFTNYNQETKFFSDS